MGVRQVPSSLAPRPGWHETKEASGMTTYGRIANVSTSEIEKRHSLHERLVAVGTLIHAIDHLVKSYPALSQMAAIGILSDGIQNAIDGRATGQEWRNVRHTYNNERDGPNPPNPTDRRCHACGFVDPAPFSHCWAHGSSDRHTAPSKDDLLAEQAKMIEELAADRDRLITALRAALREIGNVAREHTNFRSDLSRYSVMLEIAQSAIDAERSKG